MILPKGRALYENLRTSFVEFNNFLQSLKEDNFTGYVQLSSWEYRGILFLEAGEIVNAVEETSGGKRSAEEAAENIMAMARGDDGKIDAYELSPEMVTLLASASEEEVVYRDLTTDFTRLDKLIEKMREQRHSGYIDIMLKGQQGRGLVFFQDGEVVETLVGGDGPQDHYGTDSLPRILQAAEKTGATFTVYRSSAFDPTPRRVEVSEPRGFRDLIEMLGEAIGRIETLVDGLTKQKGSFRDLLKKAQVERSEEHPFLDPFMAEFEYANREIRFSGDASLEEFVKGVKECLALTLEWVPVKISRDELYGRVTAIVQPVAEKYREEVEMYGLKSYIPEFFARS